MLVLWPGGWCALSAWLAAVCGAVREAVCRRVHARVPSPEFLAMEVASLREMTPSTCAPKERPCPVGSEDSHAGRKDTRHEVSVSSRWWRTLPSCVRIRSPPAVRLAPSPTALPALNTESIVAPSLSINVPLPARFASAYVPM